MAEPPLPSPAGVPAASATNDEGMVRMSVSQLNQLIQSAAQSAADKIAAKSASSSTSTTPSKRQGSSKKSTSSSSKKKPKLKETPRALEEFGSITVFNP